MPNGDSRRSPLTYGLFAILGFVIFLMYGPIAVLIIVSFKAGANIYFPIQQFSLEQYGKIFANTQMIASLIRSFILGITTMAITTVLVISMSLVLRREFKGKDMVFYLALLGMIIPGLIYGVGTLLIFRFLNVELSFWTGLPVQVVWTLPFGLILTLTRFDPDMLSYEAAAKTLGANGWQVFRKITLPLISPQVIATALFAFTLSFDELIRSMFVQAGDVTLPVRVFTFLSVFPANPELFALGTLITLFSFVLLIGVAIFMTRGASKRKFL